jgi:threonine synthase
VEVTKGQFLSVTDDEILEAQSALASAEGVFAEPASCAPLAALRKLKSQGKLPEGLRVVMILTGSGLKDPDVVINRIPLPAEIDGTWEALSTALEL